MNILGGLLGGFNPLNLINELEKVVQEGGHLLQDLSKGDLNSAAHDFEALIQDGGHLAAQAASSGII